MLVVLKRINRKRRAKNRTGAIVILSIAGLLCIIYYVVIAFYSGPSSNFSWFWISLGAAFWLIACLRGLNFDCLALIFLGRVLTIVVFSGLIVIAVVSSFIIAEMYVEQPVGVEYAIVLGAQVKGSEPSMTLLKRLEKAYDYALANPQTTFILSGGQGNDEDISEAQCMWNYLTGRGLSEERLLMEDKSTSTLENLEFSNEMTGCALNKCGIITNDFHIYRALKLARKASYREPKGIRARSDHIMELHYIVREACAIAIEKLRGQI